MFGDYCAKFNFLRYLYEDEKAKIKEFEKNKESFVKQLSSDRVGLSIHSTLDDIPSKMFCIFFTQNTKLFRTLLPRADFGILMFC